MTHISPKIPSSAYNLTFGQSFTPVLLKQNDGDTVTIRFSGHDDLEVCRTSATRLLGLMGLDPFSLLVQATNLTPETMASLKAVFPNVDLPDTFEEAALQELIEAEWPEALHRAVVNALAEAYSNEELTAFIKSLEGLTALAKGRQQGGDDGLIAQHDALLWDELYQVIGTAFGSPEVQPILLEMQRRVIARFTGQ